MELNRNSYIFFKETNFSEILIENSYIFIEENRFENAVLKMAAIFSRPQYDKVPFAVRAQYSDTALN